MHIPTETDFSLVSFLDFRITTEYVLGLSRQKTYTNCIENCINIYCHQRHMGIQH